MADVHSKATRSYNTGRIKDRNTKREMLLKVFYIPVPTGTAYTNVISQTISLHKCIFYSVRKLFAGFARAALVE